MNKKVISILDKPSLDTILPVLKRSISNSNLLSGKSPFRAVISAENHGIRAVIAANDYRTVRDLREYGSDFGPVLFSAIKRALNSPHPRIFDGGAGDAFFSEDLLRFRSVPYCDLMRMDTTSLDPVYPLSFPHPDEVANNSIGYEPGKIQRFVFDQFMERFNDPDKYPQFIRDFLIDYGSKSLEHRPHVTAFTLSLNTREKKDFADTIEQSRGKFELMTGRYFKEVPLEELIAKGRYQLIVDNKGILSYSDDLTSDMNKYIEMLNVGGELLAAMGNEHTFVRMPNGDKIPIEQWLQAISIPGLNMEIEKREVDLKLINQYLKYIRATNIIVHITKTDETAEFPKLTFESATGSCPPSAVFRPN